mmetsp:Transcript_4904/g.10839  ORF Transcript_4904/g.10839 Transcript_4904/m.10839 type:complete len:213 (-) Transcript_4904:482-1120(-)
MPVLAASLAITAGTAGTTGTAAVAVAVLPPSPADEKAQIIANATPANTTPAFSSIPISIMSVSISDCAVVVVSDLATFSPGGGVIARNSTRFSADVFVQSSVPSSVTRCLAIPSSTTSANRLERRPTPKPLFSKSPSSLTNPSPPTSSKIARDTGGWTSLSSEPSCGSSTSLAAQAATWFSTNDLSCFFSLVGLTIAMVSTPNSDSLWALST